MNLQQTKSPLFIIVLALIIWGQVHDSFAASTVNCHCFKDRSFNPDERFAADGYILATSFNSLLARSFDIPKRRIIMIKMDEGVAQDDLLIGLKIAKLTGVDLRKFLGLRRIKTSWPEIISGLAQQGTTRNDAMLVAIGAGLPAHEAASRIADKIIADFFAISAEEVSRLRQAGLSEKEITLLYILAHARDKKPEFLLQQFSTQGKSWSEIAHNLGVEPAAAGKLILAYPAKKVAE